MNYYYGYHDPFGGMFHILGFIFAIFVLVMLLKALRGRNYHHFRGLYGDSAMNIIREKYAKGEITKEEFEAKKKDLSL